MELRPLAYYRRNSEEVNRVGQDNKAFSHFSHRDQIVNSSVTPLHHENNIQTVFTRGTFLNESLFIANLQAGYQH